jgi:hypothetical protein
MWYAEAVISKGPAMFNEGLKKVSVQTLQEAFAKALTELTGEQTTCSILRMDFAATTTIEISISEIIIWDEDEK